MKTISAKKQTVTRKWYVIDAEDKTLGRMSTAIANRLRGKHKAEFTPHVDTGDYVIVINAEKITLSGNKWDTKKYIRHTGYTGGQRSALAKELLEKKPYALVEKAVKGMLPKNKLGRQLFRNLYVYVGTEHPHEGQQPKEFNINSIK